AERERQGHLRGIRARGWLRRAPGRPDRIRTRTVEFSAYLAAWTFYLLAAAGITLMTWRVLQRYLLLELALLLQCLLMALLFMPCLALSAHDILALPVFFEVLASPAPVPQAGIRVVESLVLATVATALLAVVLALLIRLWVRALRASAETASAPLARAGSAQ